MNTRLNAGVASSRDTAAEVSDYLTTFVDAGLPIMVGEFGHNHSDGDPDEDAIMATAESLGVGYIAGRGAATAVASSTSTWSTTSM